MTPSVWITVEADRALYVDRGNTVVLCDRLPSPVTLVLLVASREAESSPRQVEDDGPGTSLQPLQREEE
jgi:hypothetical protein